MGDVSGCCRHCLSFEEEKRATASGEILLLFSFCVELRTIEIVEEMLFQFVL